MGIGTGEALPRPRPGPDPAVRLGRLAERLARSVLSRAGLIALAPVALYVLLGVAPAVVGGRWPELAHALRAAYAWTCAQVPSHTLAFGGERMALCARCLGLYGGLWTGGAAGLTVAATRLRVGWPAVLLALLPMALDVGTQALGLHQSSHALRLSTGALAGLAGGLWLLPPLQEAAERAWDAGRRGRS